uniref:pentatricopeptide repeat-containing protein At1g63130, mitochondrial-like n=1 Tax=Erigeron canadensis TaxID=72917 RepID=UPI001CB8D658|nr:pentatricopeptide repeat-containing protein At1g63130, mitochondrial-like [Erigeron canadensis]
MAARSRIHDALMKFGGISTTTRFLTLSNTCFSNFHLPFRKSLFTSPRQRRPSINCAYGHLNNLDDAYDSFEQLIVKPPYSDSEFYHLLEVVTEWKYYSASLDMFNEMCAVDVPVFELTIETIIQCYSRLYDTEKIFMLLGFCIKRDENKFSLIDYRTIIEGFIRGESTHGAEKLFKKFIKNKLLFESDADRTYHTMIEGLCKIGNHFTAIAVLRLRIGRGVGSYNLVTYNAIIDGLCEDMMIDDAFRIFEELKFHEGTRPNVFTYNSLLYALSMSGRWNEVCRILKEMHDEKITIHSTTFNILIKALCKQGKMKEAEIVEFMKVHILWLGDRDIKAYTSLIEGYCLKGELNRAMSTLESMWRAKVKPTLRIYNILLDRFTSLDDKNFWSYKRDLDSIYGRIGFKIDENSVTRYIWHRERMGKPSDEMKVRMQNHKYSVYILCLMDHCDKYEVDAALDLFYFMDGKEVNSKIDVYNILIDCTSICGRFDISRSLFRELFVKGLEPNLDTYVLMIRGFCERGLLKDAKKLHLQLENSGLQPKSIINGADIIQEYIETKPIDDTTKLFIETKRRGYSKRVHECFKFVAEYFKPI